MASFKVVNPPVYGTNDEGALFSIFGWWSDDGWETFEPVVGNPDGPGVGPWHVFCGEDRWTLAGHVGPPPGFID
jgi:hypothetical protein